MRTQLVGPYSQKRLTEYPCMQHKYKQKMQSWVCLQKCFLNTWLLMLRSSAMLRTIGRPTYDICFPCQSRTKFAIAFPFEIELSTARPSRWALFSLVFCSDSMICMYQSAFRTPYISHHLIVYFSLRCALYSTLHFFGYRSDAFVRFIAFFRLNNRK